MRLFPNIGLYGIGYAYFLHTVGNRGNILYCALIAFPIPL